MVVLSFTIKGTDSFSDPGRTGADAENVCPLFDYMIGLRPHCQPYMYIYIYYIYLRIVYLLYILYIYYIENMEFTIDAKSMQEFMVRAGKTVDVEKIGQEFWKAMA